MISQNDPLWKLKKINGTTSTIGSYGCLISCICYVLQKAGYSVTPPELANQSALFNGDLWAGWTKLVSLYPKLSYAWGETCTITPAPVDKIIRELDDGFFPIIMLDYSPTTTKVDTHYLVVLAHDENKNLKIGDPWDGAEVWLDSRYGTLDEKYKILKVDVYHFEKVANDTSSWDRIKAFLDEKKADEGMVREAFGALSDNAGLQKSIADLQAALSNKQSTIDSKDQIISDLTNQMIGKDATIGSYTDFIQKCAVTLGCKADMAEITGQIKVAVDNEDKYNSCLVDKQSIVDKQDETIKAAVVKATTQITKEKEDLKTTITTLTVQISTKDTLITELKAKLAAVGVSAKTTSSLLSKIKKLLNIK